jgi:hypothetical protein
MNIWVKATLLTIGELLFVIVFFSVLIGIIVGGAMFVYHYPWAGSAVVVLAGLIAMIVSKKKELE